MKPSNIQILLLRLALAGLFLQLGVNKFNNGWLHNTEPLQKSLDNLHQNSAGTQTSYLEKIAIPYASVWSKLITAGELALGASLFFGLLVRLSTALGIIMVINLHAATGTLYSLNFFGSPSASLIVVGLVCILLAKGGRWCGIDALLAKSNPRGIFW